MFTSALVSRRGSADAIRVPSPSLIIVCTCVCVCVCVDFCSSGRLLSAAHSGSFAHAGL